MSESAKRTKQGSGAEGIGLRSCCSILRRAHTKTYGHGVRYLKKLEQLAHTLADWRGHDEHVLYMQQLQQNHGHKTAFGPSMQSEVGNFAPYETTLRSTCMPSLRWHTAMESHLDAL